MNAFPCKVNVNQSIGWFCFSWSVSVDYGRLIPPVLL